MSALIDRHPTITLDALCKRKGWVFERAPERYRIKITERWGSKEFLYQLPRPFLARVGNARVFGAGALEIDGHIITRELSHGGYVWARNQEMKDYAEIPDGGYLSGEYVLLWGNDNFGHWLFTYLMRLMRDLPSVSLLVSERVPARFLDWLNRLGLQHVTARDGVRVEKLWVPSVVTYRDERERPVILPEAVHELRKRMLNGSVGPRTRLYLSRNRSRWRRVVNEEELASALWKEKVERAYLESLTVDEQLSLVSSAELIVVATGAASPITMFAPTDCRIVELTPPGMTGTFASRAWAHVLGQEYRRIEGKPVAQTGPASIDVDYRVDVQTVLDALK